MSGVPQMEEWNRWKMEVCCMGSPCPMPLPYGAQGTHFVSPHLRYAHEQEEDMLAYHQVRHAALNMLRDGRFCISPGQFTTVLLLEFKLGVNENCCYDPPPENAALSFSLWKTQMLFFFSKVSLQAPLLPSTPFVWNLHSFLSGWQGC